MILRDRDINNSGGWTGAADGTLEERRFYAQNWRADVVALAKDDGQPVEFIRYTCYGTAQAFDAAVVNLRCQRICENGPRYRGIVCGLSGYSPLKRTSPHA